MAVSRGTALVTGASSGIGWEIAKLLAEDRYDLVLVARTEKKLRDLGRDLEAAFGIHVTAMPADLSRPDGARHVLDELTRLGIETEVLVNNAGFGVYGHFSGTDYSKERDMIQVNIAAVTELAKGVLPGMLSRRSGKILNVASTAAFQPGPLMAVYYATKAYVLSFSEAIANELDGTGVTVTALCPGPTETEFQKAAGAQKSRLFTGPLVMDARSVAVAGYRGMQRGKRIVIPGLTNKLMTQSLRFSPRRLVTAVARRIQETRG